MSNMATRQSPAVVTLKQICYKTIICIYYNQLWIQTLQLRIQILQLCPLRMNQSVK